MSAVEDRTNPKDLVGQAKIDLSLFPPAAHIHAAHAFMDGAEKYGAYNWRNRAVKARVYISAAQRHLASYLDGEDEDRSGCHHLGHAIACLGIILDAFEVGVLIDDRPLPGRAVDILDRLNLKIIGRRLHHEAELAKRAAKASQGSPKALAAARNATPATGRRRPGK